MKHDRTVTFFWAAALAFLMAAGVSGCLATAFGLGLSGRTFLLFAAGALFYSGCFSFRRGGLAALGITALAAGYLWSDPGFRLELEALVCRISEYYNRGYGWPVVRWSGENLNGVSVTMPFAILGCGMQIVTAWIVTHRARAFWSILAIAPVVTLCLILNDTVPAMVYLAAVIFGSVLLLMTQTARRRSVRDGNRLAGMLVLPLVLGLALLFAAVPQEGYTPPPEDLAQRTVKWFQGLRFGDSLVERLVNAFSNASTEQVDLKNTGPRGQQRFKVMEVTAAVDGPLYLRGRVYDTYDGHNWTVPNP